MTRFLLCALWLLVAFTLQAQEDYKQYLDLSYAEIDSLMMIKYQKGAYSKAIPLMQAGRTKAKHDFGEQDTTFVEYTADLGFFYYKKGQYDKALPLYIQAKNTYIKVLGRSHPKVAISLNNLASLHRKTGNFDRALPLLEQAKNIYIKVLGQDHPKVAVLLNNLAGLHQAMSDYDKALTLLLQAKNIYIKVLGQNHPKVATLLNNLASLHRKIGNFDRALPLLEQAKDTREKVLGQEHPDFAASLNNLANLYQAMGAYDKALVLYMKAKKIYKKVLGQEHPSFAASLNNLATLYQIMGKYDEALSLYIQSRHIREKVLGQEHPKIAISLNNLASLHSSMGNYDKALPLLTQAKNIREKVLGQKHPDFAASLNNLADLHRRMKNYGKARSLLIQAIQVMSSTAIDENISSYWSDSLSKANYPSNRHLEQVITSMDYLYRLLQDQRKLTMSDYQNQRADEDLTKTDLEKNQRIVVDLALQLSNKLLYQISNDKDRLRILGISGTWVDRSLDVLDTKKHRFEAFKVADQNKSVLLLQATKSEAAYRLGELPDSLARQDRAQRKKRSRLQAKLAEKRSKAEKDSLRAELNKVNQDIDDFIRMIKKEYPKYHKLKYKQVQTNVTEIQALLDEQTALLEYVIGDSAVHIFLVMKEMVEWKQSYITNKALTQKTKRLHQALSNYSLIAEAPDKAYQNYTQQAHWFYQQLLAPVLSDKKNIKDLVIVTDGKLGHLPFETFLMEQAPQRVTAYNKLHYLINDYNVSYNYSATLWKENIETPRPKNNGQLFALAANYDIQLDSSMMNTRLSTDQWLRNSLSSLPAARQEVEILQENYKGFFAFDTLASERTVKAKAADYAVLHFATHGILNEKRPMLSSLALSEDNDSTESNFWQAHEISKLDLNANLVVLSACETGFGKFEEGNGIASLARAFMYAGAPSLIVSLWQVNDGATSMIMQNLYQNLANGQAIDEALRQAKLDYIQSTKGVTAHPAFWSPFIQMGKTKPVNIKTKGGWLPWAIIWGIGGVLMLIVGGLAISRRKQEV